MWLCVCGGEGGTCDCVYVEVRGVHVIMCIWR